MNFKRDLITNEKTRPALRSDGKHYLLKEVKPIVAHWTANESKGADAQANRNYFSNGSPYKDKSGKIKSRAASAHYCVDDKGVVQCLPDSEVGFHVGDRSHGGSYTPFGKNLMKGYATPNYVTIGFEMCVNSDGDWNKTYRNSARLAAWLLFRHGLEVAHLVRHRDITGKLCPKMFLESEPWEQFKRAVETELFSFSLNYARMIVVSKGLNVRDGEGVKFPVLYELQQNEIVAVPKVWPKLWAPVWGADHWVNSKFLKPI